MKRPPRLKDRTYTSWRSMMFRCFGDDARNSKFYKSRGITVCERWFSFENFLVDMGERPIGKTLDRIDNDKGYEPTNCRWATKQEQNSNRRGNVLVTHDGKTKTLTDWSKQLGISRGTLEGRMKRGWPAASILATPVKDTNRLFVAFGREQTVAQWSKESGVPVGTIRARLDRGWNVERAVSARVHKVKTPR
jgi:lambda repressor-like predicted transcriptional regulator